MPPVTRPNSKIHQLLKCCTAVRRGTASLPHASSRANSALSTETAAHEGDGHGGKSDDEEEHDREANDIVHVVVLRRVRCYIHADNMRLTCCSRTGSE